jgi:predicted phosphate transport protein (TIGR00153 family)
MFSFSKQGGEKMFFFGKKEEQIIKRFKDHLSAVEKNLEKFRNFMNSYLDGDGKSEKLAREVMKLETEADHIRRETETMMYSGAFLPNFRGDLLGLIESVDVIADRAETVVRLIDLQGTEFPEEIREDVKKQAEIVLNTYKALKKAIEKMFEDMEESAKYVSETERLEHEEDEFEWALIRKVFSLDIDRARKLELRELISLIGDIADLSEDASDRVEIILLKRRV